MVRIHNGNAGAIVQKNIVQVRVVVGEHEMEAIPYVVVTGIANYIRMGHKFKINSIAVAFHIIFLHNHVIAFP
jgi:hypothetical protein